MKTPRSLSSAQLIKKLEKFEYKISRQVGSHIRLTSYKNGEHHVTIPNHNPLKIGTLSAILKDISEHHKMTKQDLINQLWSK